MCKVDVRGMVAVVLACAVMLVSGCGSSGGGGHYFPPVVDGGAGGDDARVADPGAPDMAKAMDNCGAGQMKCGGACIDVTRDVNNCGACNLKCAPAQPCQDARCVCPSNQMFCNGNCANLNTDSLNCGGCNRSCNGQPCQNGQCTCQFPQMMCNGSCTDVTSDALNCGGCGRSCNGQLCQNGQCACPNGQLRCNGACVNVQSDAGNCGGCAVVCAMGQTCQIGKCTGAMTGCKGAIQCYNNCNGNQACNMMCDKNTTAQGKMLLQALDNCLLAACPINNGGVCDMNAMGYDVNKCNTCFANAQMANGACINQLTACDNNGP